MVYARPFDTLQSAYRPPWTPSSSLLLLEVKTFFPSFLVHEDPILLSSADVYCCTYREDVGNRLPLCEG
jgi:hypothetical protein